MKELLPDVITSDVVPNDKLDLVVDAQDICFENSSLRSIYGINCFHHFPSPTNFFAEANRVLAPGGGIILIEPYYGPFATFLYKRLFSTEDFDKKCPKWDDPSRNIMTLANQALSYNILFRDRLEFEQKFPQFEIVETFPLKSYMRYIFSGGLNFKQLLPTSTVPILKFLEQQLGFARKLFALHHIIVIRKKL